MHLEPRTLNWVGVLATGLWTLGAMFCMTLQAQAADRTNVPLRNWGAFAINREWTYDAVERLVLAGLTDRAVLNTKPMSRLEMALLIAQAIEKIEAGREGAYNDREALEETLWSLIEEFQPELAELKVAPALRMGKPHGFFFLKPVDQVQIREAFADRDLALENNQGELYRKGPNVRWAFRSRAQIGDSLSFSLHPEALLDEEAIQGRLVEGSIKLTFKNIELLVGRDSLWWGPGFHGAVLFSNNARPLELIKLSSAEPFLFPGFLKSLGPTKVTFFLARLEEDRDFPHAKLAGLRLNFAPFPSLEMGFSRAIQFGGRGRPSPTVGDIPASFIGQEGSGIRGPQDPRDNNQLFSYDVTLRLSRVDRLLPIAKDLQLYFENGSDDKTGLSKSGLLFGLFIPNLLYSPGTDLRLEYATLNRTWYQHAIYTSGFTFKGRILGHHIGGDGRDLYVRLTHRFSPDLLIGFDLDVERRGNAGLSKPAERRTEQRVSPGLDLSYRFSKHLAIFTAYRLDLVQDRGFVAGKDGADHLLQLELTYSF